MIQSRVDRTFQEKLSIARSISTMNGQSVIEIGRGGGFYPKSKISEPKKKLAEHTQRTTISYRSRDVLVQGHKKRCVEIDHLGSTRQD